MEISSVGGMQEMDPAEMAAMRSAMFTKLDTNGDGMLDASELADMATTVGTTVEQILTDGDSDEDGMMSESEMEALKPKDQPPKPGEEMGGKLYETESDTSIKSLLEAIADASEEEDSSTTIKDLIAEFIENMQAQQMNGNTTGLLVDTTA